MGERRQRDEELNLNQSIQPNREGRGLIYTHTHNLNNEIKPHNKSQSKKQKKRLLIRTQLLREEKRKRKGKSIDEHELSCVARLRGGIPPDAAQQRPRPDPTSSCRSPTGPI